MFNVSEEAQEAVARYFKDKAQQPIRVFLNDGCFGAHLAMVLDEAKPDDQIFEIWLSTLVKLAVRELATLPP